MYSYSSRFFVARLIIKFIVIDQYFAFHVGGINQGSFEAAKFPWTLKSAATMFYLNATMISM